MARAQLLLGRQPVTNALHDLTRDFELELAFDP